MSIPPNSDPRTNPQVPKPPPREPIRNALAYIAALIVLVLTVLIVFGVLTLEQVTFVAATAGSVWLLVFGFMERVRAQVNSPATSAANADIRDALAQAIVLAEQNGSVPPVGKSLAEDVIKGGLVGAVTPAMRAAAVALGVPHAIVIGATPAVLQAAMATAEALLERAPNQDELNAEAVKGL